MAKTNFTKVEVVLEQGLRKMNIDQIFEMADVSANIGSPKEKPSDPNDKKEASHLDKAQRKLLEVLERELRYLDVKQHKALYNQLGLKKQEIRELILKPSELKPEDWEKIKQIKEGIDKYRHEVLAQLPSSTNDKLVEEERRKHINKRFNVNDKWLPLH